MAAEKAPEGAMCRMEYTDFLDGNEVIGDKYGFRTFRGKGEFHKGWDIRPIPRRYGVLVKPGVSGSITGVTRDGYGVFFRPDGFSKNSSLMLYHMKLSPDLAQFKFPIKVDAFTAIGSIGPYGRTSGPHLHIELWQNGNKYNPAFVLK